MNQQITESVSYDRGYQDGLAHGNKTAWDLVGEYAAWTAEQMLLHQHTDRYVELHAQWRALLHAQKVIKKGKM